ncbi:hypothetical protein BGX24_007188 [Mortierella sp. AD032]|nr:hypothetical protein BGX24_007188 [Mortierella sp. AD032]
MLQFLQPFQLIQSTLKRHLETFELMTEFARRGGSGHTTNNQSSEMGLLTKAPEDSSLDITGRNTCGSPLGRENIHTGDPFSAIYPMRLKGSQSRSLAQDRLQMRTRQLPRTTPRDIKNLQPLTVV